MPIDGPTPKDVMLAEWKALRDETIATLNARIWGTLTYVAVAGGIGAWYGKGENPAALLLLVLTALPLLWYTSLRERSRIRIGSYIKVVLEPRMEGLSWERCVQAWRAEIAGERKLLRGLDRWCHILSLTGIYTLGSVFGLLALLTPQEFTC